MIKNYCDLTGKAAIVTGSSRGLGRYMARALARAGADVAVTSRTASSLDEVCAEIREIGRDAYPHSLDVRSLASIETTVENVFRHFGKIDVLVNNAGTNIRRPAVDVTLEDWNLVLETNLRGPFFMAQAVAKKMIPRRGGRIINIGSVTSAFAYAGLAPYCASRGGIRQLTMSLADDWGIYGITVNCLAPGWFKTQQTKPLFEDPSWVDYIVDRIPLKRVGEPEDLDGAVVFLASDSSRYLTGQTIFVDGGITTGATRATSKKAASPSS
jgi:NAD(P)-dependent dehydrogenase (short-subunit alcohol dehydrogenase family)